MRIAITGSTGLIGSAFVTSLRRDGHEVLRLVRRTSAASDEIAWDPRDAEGGLDPAALDGVHAVIHLAGADVGRRWTEAYKATIRSSRVVGTRNLVAALTAMQRPPAILLAGSGIHWYGETGARVDESSPPGTGFLAGVVREWEESTRPATERGIRVVNMRTGIVLSPQGGMLSRLLLPFRLGLGARLGSGNQIMSWITLDDYGQIVEFLLDHPEISGPVNITTPNPVTNAEFTAALAAAVHRPAVLALPTAALTLAVGEGASEFLASLNVAPARLLAAGYRYRHPELGEALTAVLTEQTAQQERSAAAGG